MTVHDLKKEERVFLAGMLRAMIHVDGVVDDEEISFVDHMRREDRFEDMDDCLDEYDKRMEEGADIRSLAAEVTRREARNLILRMLKPLTMRSGYQRDQEQDFFNEIQSVWSVAK